MKRAKIELTRDELWELICNFDASFEPGPGNELAEKVSEKLWKAFRGLDL